MKSHRDMVTLRFLAGFGLEFGGWGGDRLAKTR